MQENMNFLAVYEKISKLNKSKIEKLHRIYGKPNISDEITYFTQKIIKGPPRSKLSRPEYEEILRSFTMEALRAIYCERHGEDKYKRDGIKRIIRKDELINCIQGRISPPGTTAETPRAINASLRNSVWNQYIGERKSPTCFCCQREYISRANFECGHVVSRADGGAATLENLRPICGLCNKSMGKKNMMDFINENGYGRLLPAPTTTTTVENLIDLCDNAEQIFSVNGEEMTAEKLLDRWPQMGKKYPRWREIFQRCYDGKMYIMPKYQKIMKHKLISWEMANKFGEPVSLI